MMGDKGYKGVKGMKGGMGIKGENGTIGAKGTNGTIGDKGTCMYTIIGKPTHFFMTGIIFLFVLSRALLRITTVGIILNMQYFMAAYTKEHSVLISLMLH